MDFKKGERVGISKLLGRGGPLWRPGTITGPSPSPHWDYTIAYDDKHGKFLHATRSHVINRTRRVAQPVDLVCSQHASQQVEDADHVFVLLREDSVRQPAPELTESRVFTVTDDVRAYNLPRLRWHPLDLHNDIFVLVGSDPVDDGAVPWWGVVSGPSLLGTVDEELLARTI